MSLRSKRLVIVMIGGLLVILMKVLIACTPSMPSTAIPSLPRPTNVITIGVTSTPSPPQPPVTTLWFLIDRSESMNKCADQKTLYQLPGFFAQVAAVISSNFDLPLQIAEVFFPSPKKDQIKPTPAPQIWRDLREQNIVTIPSRRNEYKEGLDEVSFLAPACQKHVVLVLTDGTFTENQDDHEKEQREIEEGLKHLIEIKKAEVYAIFCTHPDSENRAWNAPAITNMLSGTYELKNLSEWIDDLGNALFGKWIYSTENIRIGWITSTTYAELPGETITFSVDIVPIDFSRKPEMDHMNDRYGFDYDDREFVFRLEGDFAHSRPGGYPCKPRGIRLRLKDSAGLYLIRYYRTPLVEDIGIAKSVNHAAGIITLSLKASPDFEPSRFTPCYSGIELMSNAAFTIGKFQNLQATLVWQPPPQVEPGDYPASLYIKNLEGKVIFTHSIILPVRFQPIPVNISVTAMTTEGNKKLVDEIGNPLYRLVFRYDYVPREEQPQIFLCSSYDPIKTWEKNQVLACGKAICCDGSGKYRGYCSITCPIPISCPAEVSAFCTNCVPIKFGEVCAEANTFMTSPNGGPPRYSQTYTVTLYECLAEHCGYTGLFFVWPKGRKTVTTTCYFTRRGNTYIWLSPSR